MSTLPPNWTIKKISKIYTLPGPPIPLLRHRCGKARAWDSQKQLKFSIACYLKTQHDNQPFFTGPLFVTYRFFFQPPGSLSQRKKSLLLGQGRPQKPDLDNLVKFIADVSNNILYNDDSTIVAFSAIKLYSEEEYTEFQITELYAQNPLPENKKNIKQ